MTRLHNFLAMEKYGKGRVRPEVTKNMPPQALQVVYLMSLCSLN